MDEVSIARALSKLGWCSRAEARGLIAAGRVHVDGVVVRNPDTRIDMRRARITVDGQPVRAGARVYLAMYKPAGVVTTTADELGRTTAYEILPRGLSRVGAVGRLDLESEGLLLFTNDTRWADRITDPASHVDKVYHVQLDRPLGAEEIAAAAAGVDVGRGERLAFRSVAPLDAAQAGEAGHWIRVTIDEGRNRHIRRVLQALGIAVIRLVRVAIGPLRLGSLDPGATRRLDRAEVDALDAAARAGQ